MLSGSKAKARTVYAEALTEGLASPMHLQAALCHPEIQVCG